MDKNLITNFFLNGPFKKPLWKKIVEKCPSCRYTNWFTVKIDGFNIQDIGNKNLVLGTLHCNVKNDYGENKEEKFFLYHFAFIQDKNPPYLPLDKEDIHLEYISEGDEPYPYETSY